MRQTCSNLRTQPSYPEQSILSILIAHAGHQVPAIQIAKLLKISPERVSSKIRWLVGCGCATSEILKPPHGVKTNMVMLTLKGLAEFVPEGWTYVMRPIVFPLPLPSNPVPPKNKTSNLRNNSKSEYSLQKKMEPIFKEICLLLKTRPGLSLNEIATAMKTQKNLTWYYLKRMCTRKQIENTSKPARYFLIKSPDLNH